MKKKSRYIQAKDFLTKKIEDLKELRDRNDRGDRKTADLLEKKYQGELDALTSYVEEQRPGIEAAQAGAPMSADGQAQQQVAGNFAQGGSVTAGNSSQTSDGAAFVMVMSEKMMKELNIEPIARLVSYATVGVEPRIMGIGPVKAIPKALDMAGLKMNDLSLVELNEAFASQSVAVLRETGLNPDIVNVNGGAIALGHPLGCTGGKLSVQLINELRRTNGRYGMVTMCVGTGQGAAGVIELLN